MKTAAKVLLIIGIVLSAIIIFMGIIFMAGGGVVATVVDDAEAEIAGAVVAGIGVFYLIYGIYGLIVSIGSLGSLKKSKKARIIWGVLNCPVMAVASVFMFIMKDEPKPEEITE